ncbi:histone-fold-containing protein [Radiomyces spectabilis]|uniref:histone-fold-containing protein n=1 Tax=Radiomyces spectabilis TaxID=64574 RepID=UPI00221FF827|nr:histone-fold-containing protein [Radiomyces spectabilis]KAI8366625.1 histone-fold-containing protein [Radiomyces spectabilis]
MASENLNNATPNKHVERPPGTTFLPQARVKRVIKEDKDVSLINAEATFCVSFATELFMEYLVTEGFSRAKRDKRKTIYYKDLATAVNEVEQFEFLEDVIPQTMTLKAALERRKEALGEEHIESRLAKKQKTSSTAMETNSTATKEVDENNDGSTVTESEAPTPSVATSAATPADSQNDNGPSEEKPEDL